VALVYEQFQTQVSLRGFMHIAGLPYWRLRDYLRGASRRQQRQRREQALQQAVQQTALEQPTYGYWRLYPALKARGWCVGRERVRRLLAALDLAPEHPSKKRRAAPGTATAAELPEGRRVQIDATRPVAL
jgi:putative transposase